MKTAVKRYGFDDSDPIVTWINWAIHDFETAYDWPFLRQAPISVVTVAGTKDYTPAGLNNMARIRNISIDGYDGVLKPISDKVYDEESDKDADGVPTHYIEFTSELGGAGSGSSTTQITLWPTPDAAYTMRVRTSWALAELSTDANSPAIPRRYHQALVQKAVAYGFEADNSEDRASTANNHFEDKILRGIREYGTGKVRQVRDVQGYGS
jgi:hypothetical protein